jgi:hypothetical protein
MPREIRTTSRGYRTEFEQSINGDIIRALVEIITNSDDSYTVAEKNGPITITFSRPARGSRHGIADVSVTDHAGGMTEAEMSHAADIGVESSGFAKTKTVRGLLGRGLKQAAFGIGSGAEIASVKGGVLSYCRLYDGEKHECMFAKGSEYAGAFGMSDHSPRIPRAQDRDDLGIPADGTRVTLHVASDKWTTNKHQDALKQNLQNHFALRQLFKKHNDRPVFLVDRDGDRYGPLEYTNPVTDPPRPVLSVDLKIEGFPKAQAHLRVHRASIDLGPIDEYSESGITIRAENVPIQQTMFGRESHPLAGRFFGRLKCDYIAELLREENAKGSIKLVTLQRLGLAPHHPFAKALTRAAVIHIDRLIQEESERGKKKDSDEGRTKLSKALQDMVPVLNKLMSSLLAATPGAVGPIKANDPTVDPNPEPPPPPGWHQPLEDLEFFPEELGVRLHAEKRTALFVRDAAFADKQRLQISVEGEGVRVLSRDLAVDHRRAVTNDKDGPVGYSKLPFRIEGTQAGTNAIVHVSAGHARAMLLVTVGSHKEPPPPSPPPKGGFLQKIEMQFYPDSKFRAHFDSTSGTLRINLSHPVQKYYDALRTEKDRSKRRAWVVAVADAMTDALFRQVISAYIEDKGKIPRNDGWGKTMNELDALWHSVGVGVHEVADAKLLAAD